jgi:co-chaperonin GroES (HSP10)
MTDIVITPIGERQAGWRAHKGPQPTNKSGFRAVGHRLLLLTDVVEETTVSGIVLPKKAVKAEQDLAIIATVVEIGCDAWSDKSTDFCAAGDRVLVGQYTGKFHQSAIDGKIYRFVNDLDIISPMENAQ